jgi:hypothetical protein
MLLIWIVRIFQKTDTACFLLGCVFIRRPSELSIHASFKNQNSTIGGNGGGGIVEIPNLHGGQIDFNHVSVGTNLSIKLNHLSESYHL